jgi:hypothetical protein
MKTKFVLLTVAAVSMFGAFANAPSASAAPAPAATPAPGTGGGIGHFDCKGEDSYDVQKGMCIPTTGATAYSPQMYVSREFMRKHKKRIINAQ